MSSIPTRQIDGDVAVGRNVSAGGDVNIQGSVRVGHRLAVEGWLDAKNIKGTCKGLFGSEEALRSAYPDPRPGWFALVGDTLPADVWRAERKEGGSSYEWKRTEETGGEFKVDLDLIRGEYKAADDSLKDYLVKRIQGKADDSAPFYDPHKWLERFNDEAELNAALDALHAQGDGGSELNGFYRGDIKGTPFSLENIALSYATEAGCR